MPLGLQSGVWLPVGIALSALVSEDAATGIAALLTASGHLDLRIGFLSAFFGIWLGDLLLFATARKGRHLLAGHSLISRVADQQAFLTVRAWFSRHGAWALVLTRFVPGTRLLTYVTAGASNMRASLFATVTALCALAWVGIIFAVTHQTRAASVAMALPRVWQLLVAVGVLITFLVALRQAGPRLSRQIAGYSRWEFWPAWLFYPPVALMCLWLGVKYRGFALPSAANPGQKNGGIIGESKIAILHELRAHAAAAVANSFLVPVGSAQERSLFTQHFAGQQGILLPMVLKPDTAQRGAGFRKLNAWEDAPAYFAQVTAPVVAQEYVPGPHEAGIFYYRLPGEAQGRIFSITHKEFPVVTGDGVSTLEELILSDERAVLLADTYLTRFAGEKHTVVPVGQAVRLVEAGNHCQGCIFRSGAHLLTPELETAIDAIACGLPGFFIGRFDIRYSSPEELRAGRGFKIIELNGAASEATDIYDPSMTLLNAYRTLYRQWELVYAIGAENRRRGASVSSAWDVFCDWLSYQKTSAMYPAAD